MKSYPYFIYNIETWSTIDSNACGRTPYATVSAALEAALKHKRMHLHSPTHFVTTEFRVVYNSLSVVLPRNAT